MEKKLARFANANGVGLRPIIHGNESNGLLGVLVQEHALEWGGINGKPLGILEIAVGLHLDAAILAIAQLSYDLQSPVRQYGFLDAWTRH